MTRSSQSAYMVLFWSKKFPVVPGWYWWRYSSTRSPMVVSVYDHSGVMVCSFPEDEPCPVRTAGGEWAGPIPYPDVKP